MRAKTDWVKLKIEYLTGPIEDVAEFCRQRLGKETAKNGQLGRMTTGWADERVQLNLQAYNEAKAKYISEMTLPNEELLKAKGDVLKILTEGVGAIRKLQEKKPINVADLAGQLKVLWSVIKTELNEPTVITVNDNTNNNNNVNFGLSDLLSELKKDQ